MTWTRWNMDCDCGALHIYWGNETEAHVEIPSDGSGDFRPALEELRHRLGDIIHAINAMEEGKNVPKGATGSRLEQTAKNRR